MAGGEDEGLHDFVAGRYRDLRRSAFLMCGDWVRAEEVAQAALARFVNESARSAVDDPDAYVYADVMAAFQRKASRREHVFVAKPDAAGGRADPGGAGAEAKLDAAGTEAQLDAAGAEAKLDAAGGRADPDGAGADLDGGDADPIRAILVLDALHKLSPRCRAVIVLRQWDGFAVDETADILDLPDDRVEAYEAAGLAALDDLLSTEAVPA